MYEQFPIKDKCVRQTPKKGRITMSDLRTEKTCTSLKNAFLDLLEQYRFEDITVQQLCQNANIRRATFYTHFADKYDFLAFYIQEMRKEFVTRIKNMDSISADQKENYCDLMFHELLEFFKERPKLVTNIKNSQMLPIMSDIFAEEVQKSVYHFLIENCQEDPKTLEMKAYFYAGGLLQLLLLWTRNQETFPVDRINWLKFLTQ